MKCNNCGSEIMNGSQFCQSCGATVLSQAPQQPMQGGYQQPMQQGYNPQQPMQQGFGNQQTFSAPGQGVSNEDAGWGLKILSLLLPLVGLILWLVKKDKEPVAAKTCLTWAGIGFIVNIVLGILF